ncbi:5-hydroxytryptamine receptor 1A-like [Clavelina lepadiformis]|uniref:5-hydroxytryptamine receptor 1A-like n=1 Tax=Clavelina lepadiformis TaxID=159417 RepID=UPI0040415CE9
MDNNITFDTLPSSSGKWNITILSVVACLFGLIIVVGVLGNAIIIASIIRERKLHTRGHYLIGSLAITDLLVSLIVSPFFAFMTLHFFSPASDDKAWMPHRFVCQLLVFLDVTCCTASIFHLCVIACDRYKAVTKLRYLQKRKFCKVLPTIFGIWLFAILLSLAPHVIFLQSNNNNKNTNFTYDKMEALSLRNTSDIFYPVENFATPQEDNQSISCLMVNDNKIYRIVATTVAFYLPLFIIIIIYWRVAVIAWGRIHHNITLTPFPSTMTLDLTKDDESQHASAKSRRTSNLSLITMKIKRSACFPCCFGQKTKNGDVPGMRRQQAVSKNVTVELIQRNESKVNLKGFTSSIAENNNCLHPKEHLFTENQRWYHGKHSLTDPRQYSASCAQDIDSKESLLNSEPVEHTGRAQMSCSVDSCEKMTDSASNTANYLSPADQLTEIDKNNAVMAENFSFEDDKCERLVLPDRIPSITLTPVCSHSNDGILSQTLSSNDLFRPENKQLSSIKRSYSDCIKKTNLRPAVRARSFSIRSQNVSISSDCPRSRSLSVSLVRTRLTINRERKVIRTMGAVIGAFVICWLPFFIKELLVPFCGESCSLDPVAEIIINWLGYANSALNPFIYAFANDEFSKAIAKLLRDLLGICKRGTRR